MSMSSNSRTANALAASVSTLLYRDLTAPLLSSAKTDPQFQVESGKNVDKQMPPGPSLREIEELLESARCQARAEIEAQLKSGYELKVADAAASVVRTIELFMKEKKTYFGKVESEVVHLALAISAKILHRESQVDPLLVEALVRVAIERLRDGSKVSIRVSSLESGRWREYMATFLNGMTIAVIEDESLGPLDAIVETDLGSANFSIDAQLKEVEQGFFDLLAQRPANK